MADHVRCGGQNVVKIAFDAIATDRYENGRQHTDESVATLAASIIENGQSNPLRVARSGRGRNVRYDLVQGFGRWEAIRLIREGFEHEGREYEPRPDFEEEALVTICEVEGEAEALLQNLVENLHRRNPSQAELGRTVRALREAGLDDEEVCRRLGRGASTVGRAARFENRATKKLKELSEGGLIDNATAAHAAALSKPEQNVVVDEVRDGRSPLEAVNDARARRDQPPIRAPRAGKGQLISFLNENEILTAARDGDELMTGIAVGVAFALGKLDAVTAKPKEVTDYLCDALGDRVVF